MIKVLSNKADLWVVASNTIYHKKIFLAHDVHTSRIAFSGRHSEAMEAEYLGVPLIQSRRGRQMEGLPGPLRDELIGQGAFRVCSRHDWFLDEAFCPWKEQSWSSNWAPTTDFPLWIGNFFGVENAKLKVECLNEMNPIDENDFWEEAHETEFVEEVGQSGRSQSAQERKEAATLRQRSEDTAKRSFLKMLIRCRMLLYTLLLKKRTISSTLTPPHLTVSLTSIQSLSRAG